MKLAKTCKYWRKSYWRVSLSQEVRRLILWTGWKVPGFCLRGLFVPGEEDYKLHGTIQRSFTCMPSEMRFMFFNREAYTTWKSQVFSMYVRAAERGAASTDDWINGTEKITNVERSTCMNQNSFRRNESLETLVFSLN